MPTWLLLGLAGVGGYLLLTKSASASTSAPAQLTPGQAAQSLMQNPSGLAPGFQGQATGPYTPYVPPPQNYEPPAIPNPYNWVNPADIGLTQSEWNAADPYASGATASGLYDPFTGRWY